MRDFAKLITQDDIQRFMSKITERENGCWEWTGSRHQIGHGYFSVGRSIIYAHRFSYVMAHGDIPKDLYVCHSCDNPWCVNPKHLFAGTANDNTQDMMNKGRNLYTTRRLSESEVIEMRTMYANGGVTIKDVADKFGVSRHSAGNVIRGKSHVEYSGAISRNNSNHISDEKADMIRREYPASGLSMRAFAESVGVDYSTVANIVNGATHVSAR